MSRIWRIWALALLIGVISTYGFAAGNGILPAGHWAYEAMSELARDGLLVNYPVKKSGGDLLTRYEMANYLKQMLVRLEQAKTEPQLTDDQVKIINRLLEEFKVELLTLGVNVTDLGNMSPTVKTDSTAPSNDYMDLDYILSNDLPGNSSMLPTLPSDPSEPYYLMGEYFSPDLKQNVFFFSPETYMDPKILLELKDNHQWDIIYSTGSEFSISFIIVKGIFPVGSQKVEGYYFFPLENGKTESSANLEKDVYSLLNLLSQNYEVNNLWQFKGPLPFAEILGKETYGKLHVTDGLQIGEFLVSTRKANATVSPSPSTIIDFDNNWLKNPFPIENNPLNSKNDPLFGNDFSSDGNSFSDWPNLFSTTTFWQGTVTPDGNPDNSWSELSHYTWNPLANDRWSSLLFSFQLVTDKTLASDQPFFF